MARVNHKVPRLSKLQEAAWRCSKDACNLYKLEHTLKMTTPTKTNLFIQQCVDGNTKKVREALEAGFRVSRVDSFVYTALHRICEHWDNDGNHLNIATLLVEFGANVDGREWKGKTNPSHDGWTPMHLGAWNGKTSAVEFLLSHGGNPLRVDWYGQTPLQIALASGHDETADVLSKGSERWKRQQRWMMEKASTSKL